MDQFRDNTAESRFEWEEDGAMSFADYSIGGDTRSLLYVETPVAFRGRGAAGRLLAAIIADARERGFKLRPVCGYAVAYFRRHQKDVADVLA
jgi:predicted GNAT family acetyltransferase